GEKTCLALVWATKRLRHYCLAHKVKVVSKLDPLKFLHTTPALVGRLARWVVLLTEFELSYETKKTIKGRAISELLA
nr:hypothetical protein [Vibrio vulnificus]